MTLKLKSIQPSKIFCKKVMGCLDFHVPCKFIMICIFVTALDAMRKAYEEELEQEKEKYRHALKTMFTDSYVEDIRRRHE